MSCAPKKSCCLDSPLHVWSSRLIVHFIHKVDLGRGIQRDYAIIPGTTRIGEARETEASPQAKVKTFNEHRGAGDISAVFHLCKPCKCPSVVESMPGNCLQFNYVIVCASPKRIFFALLETKLTQQPGRATGKKYCNYFNG